MVAEQARLIEHPITHIVKFEACLCWPDGAKNALGKTTIVRLYRKSDLQALVDQCRDEKRPVTWRDVVESGATPVAQNHADASTGYFYFGDGEEEDDETRADSTRWLFEFKKLDEWPDGPGTRFYLAVQGCVVALPLSAAKLEGGKPKRLEVAAFKDKHFIDAADHGCLMELEAYKKDVDGQPALMWNLEAAFAAQNGDILKKGGQPYCREVLDHTWSRSTPRLPPGEAVPRLIDVAVIPVIPLAAFDARESSTRPLDKRWTVHPDLPATMNDELLGMFNLPATKPQLRWGLNVGPDGRPERKQMFPSAYLDLTWLGARGAVLDAVVVRFLAGGVKSSVAPGTTLDLTTLRAFAPNRTNAAQIPFGDAVCLTDESPHRSRIKIFDAAGFDVISPIQPQYTQRVTPAEQLYEPLGNVSGGRLSGGVLVEYLLAKSPRRGGNGTDPMQTAFGNPAHDSWAPNVDAVRRLAYYHVEHFSIGGTGGIFTSLRGGTVDNPAHDHVGLDLYNFAHWPYDQSSEGYQGEAVYAMFRGRVNRCTNAGLYFLLLGKYENHWRQIVYMHTFATMAPGVAHLTNVTHSQMVWAGTFLGWGGSSGNAEGPNVSSKHLHLYYHVFDSAAIPALTMGPHKVDPADLFQAGTAVGADQKKNQYPFVRGRVRNTHGRTFGAEHVKVIAYDRSDGRVSPLVTTDHHRTRILAVTTCNRSVGNNGGYFEMHIPADTPVGLLITRAYCPTAAIGDASDCTDVTLEIGPFAPDPAYNTSAGAEELDDVTLDYRQRVRGRVLNPSGHPRNHVLVELRDVAANRSVGSVHTGADGRFEALAPAGHVVLRLGPTGAVTHDVPARAAGVDHDAGDLTM